MDKYKIKDCTDRLYKESVDNAHKMLYMWIKQDVITLTEYQCLVKNLTILDVSDNEVGWFNEYGEVDEFLFNELDKKGKEFPIITELKPSSNTIEAIKLLCSGR